MNILMMTNTYIPIVGGVERSIESLSERFREKGHKVLIVAPSFEGTPEDERDVIRVPAIQKFNGSDFSIHLPIPVELSNAITDFAPDIVHSHHPFLMGDTALRMATKFKVPLVFTHHTKYEDYTHYIPLDSTLVKRFVIKLSTGYANLAHQVIAPSQSIHDILVKRGVKTPIAVVPTGVDLARFDKDRGARFRKKWKIPPRAFVVGHIGRLASEKNVLFLAESVAQLMQKHENVHFLLAGKGTALDDIMRIFREHQLVDRVHVTGAVAGDDVSDAYHAMDIFVFASKTETQGLVLTEAAASGTPIVALSAEAVREVIRDGINGKLVRKQDTDDYVAAMEWMMDRTAAERRMITQHCLKTAQKYSLDRLSRKMLEIYNEAIKRELIYYDADHSVWSRAAARLKTEWTLLKNITQSAGTALNRRTVKKSLRLRRKSRV